MVAIFKFCWIININNFRICATSSGTVRILDLAFLDNNFMKKVWLARAWRSQGRPMGGWTPHLCYLLGAAFHADPASEIIFERSRNWVLFSDTVRTPIHKVSRKISGGSSRQMGKYPTIGSCQWMLTHIYVVYEFRPTKLGVFLGFFGFFLLTS